MTIQDIRPADIDQDSLFATGRPRWFRWGRVLPAQPAGGGIDDVLIEIEDESPLAPLAWEHSLHH